MTKDHNFVSRLLIFTQTFVSLNSSNTDYTVLWHEAISGRNVPDVA